MKIIFLRLTGSALLATALAGTLALAENSKPTFDPASIDEISWKVGEQSLKLKLDKKNQNLPVWKKLSGPTDLQPDSWNIHRRLVLLSNPENLESVNLTNPVGGVVILKSNSLKPNRETIEGEFNDDGFRWKTGAAQGKGYLFSKRPEIKELFDEGLRSLAVHTLQVCTPEKVTAFEVLSSHWNFSKIKNKWMVTQPQGSPTQNPGRVGAIQNFLKSFCHVEVDHFLQAKTEFSNATPAFKIYEGKKENKLIETSSGVFKFSGYPPFTSKSFTEILKINADDVKDSSLEEGRIALDPQKSQNERIQAIRTMKANGSPEAIPALKAIVNEKTEIDLYRYEAVDALAAIGTKEAYKIIADRLAEVGRSGFELRLARALALGLGHNFVSDEKTPEPERRAEVQDLLAFYRGHSDKVHSSEK